MASIRLVTEVPGPRSKEITQRRRAATARGAAYLSELAIESARGAVVVDADGNSLLDFAGGIGVLAVGHRPDSVVAALKSQADRLIHFCSIVGSYEPYVGLAERLCELAPVTGPAKAVLLNSGAEAVETAVKIARSATGRQAIVVFEGAYHGRTNLTLAMTSKYGLFKKGFGPFAPEIYRVPFPDPSRSWALSEEEYGEQAVAALDRAMVAQVDPSAIAAIVVEPVQGEGGFLPVPPALLARIRELCDEHGIVMVADEVQSGMGRTGRLFAVDHYDVTPDLVTVAKSLGAGMPISAVVGRAELMDAPHPGGLGGTYSGNPLACVAALEAIEIITAPGFLERARELGERMRERLERFRQRHEQVSAVRGLGPMLAIELIDPISGRAAPELVQRVTQEALAGGLVIIRCGLHGNCIRLMPPLDIDHDELDEGLDVLEKALASVLENDVREDADASRGGDEGVALR